MIKEIRIIKSQFVILNKLFRILFLEIVLIFKKI